MVKKSLCKNTIREIKGSFGRFLAILAIVALGVGFFAGLQVTKDAMVKTGDEYFREKGLFDLRMISTLGLYDEDVESIKTLPFVTQCEGSVSNDFIVRRTDGSMSVIKLHTISENINRVTLVEGRMPEAPGECVVDSRWMTAEDLGTILSVSDSNSDDALEMLATTELKVVGLVKAVNYVNFERGNTVLGSGKIAAFVYTLPNTYTVDYYTEILVTTEAGRETIYSDNYNNLIDEEVDEAKALLDKLAQDRYEDLYNEASETLADAEKKLDDGKRELADAEKKLADAKDEIEKNEADLKEAETTLFKNEADLADAKKEAEEKEASLKDAKRELKSAKESLESMKAYMTAEQYGIQFAIIEETEKQITAGEKEIKSAKAEFEKADKEIEDAKNEILDGYRKIEDAKKDVEDAYSEIEEAKATIEEHEEEVADGKDRLNEFTEPETYVLTRNTNIGYVCFENDSKIVEGIGNVFPVFFFLVAALVCMTTMNRMVEEQRTQIGVMKALGYSETSIMGKYISYSGIAALVGCVGGFIFGSWLFPYVIWIAYGIMYTMTDIVFVLDVKLAIVSGAVALLCSVGATYFTLHKELHSQAADLIRPKAPENGKRVFLEHIGFIWKRLKFTTKVSVRNVFRYKKRLFMMVLGVGGCYGLLITGFGIKDSIADVCDCQFNNIQKYDMTVSFRDNATPFEKGEFEIEVDNIGNYLYTSTKTVDVIKENRQKSATLVVFDDSNSVLSGSDFINFLDKNDKTISLPGPGEAIITMKMADLLDISVGDEVILRDPDMNDIRVTVSGIMRNYVYNWVYIMPETYENQMGREVNYNTAFVKTGGNGYELSTRVGKLDGVSSVSVTDEMSKRIDSMMESLNMVVLLVISCAAALAFIVMYNLTNINITERLREIATLKVLGFYPEESAIYVFRENFILTALGCVAGFFMGYGLHRYVMYNINVEVVTFDTKILPQSYLYGILLTFAFALIVDFVLFFKLEKIKMAESLKSVE